VANWWKIDSNYQRTIESGIEPSGKKRNFLESQEWSLQPFHKRDSTLSSRYWDRKDRIPSWRLYTTLTCTFDDAILVYFSSVSSIDGRIALLNNLFSGNDKKKGRTNKRRADRRQKWPFNVAGRKSILRFSDAIIRPAIGFPSNSLDTQRRVIHPEGWAAVYLNPRASNYIPETFIRRTAFSDALRCERFTYPSAQPIRLSLVLARVHYLINNGLAHLKRQWDYGFYAYFG